MKKISFCSMLLCALLTACPETKVPTAKLVTTLDFTSFDAQAATLGLRAGKSNKISLDAEPEYVAVSADSKTAYVVLQESNGFAVVDLEKKKISKLKSLGLKDFSKSALDASDKDKKINIKAWPVFGAYMPDAIAAVDIAGKTYVLSANEGDGREYGDDGSAFSDETKIGKLKLDPTVFKNAAELQKDENLGRLKVSSLDGDLKKNDKGEATRLVSFGARSLSIWDGETLELVADTGDLFERKTAELTPKTFNGNGTEESFDSRSDNKGPEPEGVTTGVVGGKTFAFVGLERVSGLVVLDISKPSAPKYVDYVHYLPKPNAKAQSNTAGDLGPEGILFIPASESVSGKPLVVVSYEMSGSVTIYTVENTGKLTKTGRYQATPVADVYGESVAEITAYDKASKQLFLINGKTGGLDILDIANVSTPKLKTSISLKAYGKGANSVAVKDGVVAVAVEAKNKTENGKVALLNTDGSKRAEAVEVGALPDMLTFTPDGKYIVVANEGEPNDDYSVDPKGSVSIIDVKMALKPTRK